MRYIVHKTKKINNVQPEGFMTQFICFSPKTCSPAEYVNAAVAANYFRTGFSATRH